MKQLKSTISALFILSTTGGAGSLPVTAANLKDKPYLPSYSLLQDDIDRAHHNDVAYFAGGCFWGMQDALNGVPGVVSTIVGYSGGKTKSPTYDSVCRHDTGHAETVRVVFDPTKITYQALAEDFLELHDPTTLNRQGPDIGDQYRSAIFYSNDAQKNAAQKAIAHKTQKGGPGYRVVTSLEKFKVFYTAEGYHQNYIAKTGSPSCHIQFH
jgi:peptide methionine sulfoxide reductase msrA/msrB